jgi:hypothetical protein
MSRTEEAPPPRRNGDGCPVVAHDENRENRGMRLSQLPQGLRVALQRLEPGDQVEVLLDDGRVVRTEVRDQRPWELAGGQWLVSLVGFVGGYSLARCRPLGWRGWTRRAQAGGTIATDDNGLRAGIAGVRREW